MNFVVGLTGGIGSGKSTVSKLFEDLGITVIDTDVISRKLTEVNGIAINRIRENFGEAYTNSIEGIDRAKMRELIFSDKEARNKLEKILHPLILNEVKTQIEKVINPDDGKKSVVRRKSKGDYGNANDKTTALAKIT